MKILFMNIRGLGRFMKKIYLKEMLAKERPNFVCVQDVEEEL